MDPVHGVMFDDDSLMETLDMYEPLVDYMRDKYGDKIYEIWVENRKKSQP